MLKSAYNLAKSKYNNSHSPYSNYKVAAVVKAVGSDKLYTGVNVENASFGGTICAERSAITSMITDLGYVEIEYVLIMTKDASNACLICQQFISEFSKNKSIPIHLYDESGFFKTVKSHVGFNFNALNAN